MAKKDIVKRAMDLAKKAQGLYIDVQEKGYNGRNLLDIGDLSNEQNQMIGELIEEIVKWENGEKKRVNLRGSQDKTEDYIIKKSAGYFQIVKRVGGEVVETGLVSKQQARHALEKWQRAKNGKGW